MSDVIEKKLKLVKPKILYNSSQIQDLKSLNCGFFCYYYIKKRDNGTSPMDILLKFSKNTKKNDNILEKLLKNDI